MNTGNATGGQGAGNTGPAPDNSATAKLGFGMKLPAGEGDAMPRARIKIPQQTIVLMIVLSVSAGAIFGMRKLGTRAGIAMGGEVVDYTPPDSDRTKSYDRIMGDLARIQNPLDVALGEFGKSPFMLQQQAKPTAVAEPVANEATAEQRAAADAKRKLEQRHQELTDKLSQLKMQSIMGGKVPLARINGVMLKVGDVAGEDFTILAIKDRTVTLGADGQTFELTLDLLQAGPKTSPVKIGQPAPKGK